MVAEGKEDGVLDKLSEDKTSEYRCVISKKGDKYYWKSREDKEMEKSEGGIYITFTRSDGAPDYVRTINPVFLKVAAAAGLWLYRAPDTHAIVNNLLGQRITCRPCNWKTLSLRITEPAISVDGEDWGFISTPHRALRFIGQLNFFV